DVLAYCAHQRATMLDQLNQLDWWSTHQEKYDWTGAATLAQIADCARSTQMDLDTVAACASIAINHPEQAKMPADYAAAQVPPRKYPSSQPLPVGPKPKPGEQVQQGHLLPPLSSLKLSDHMNYKYIKLPDNQ
ncbi:MAG: hypothetical protein J2P36_22240, partial [Ktedonobacteraceae bacterium]|nr:hypothetical protein [Ktedonobacteraceae bacterium]